MNKPRLRNRIRWSAMAIFESVLMIKLASLKSESFLLALGASLLFMVQLFFVLWLFIIFFEMEEFK